MSSSYRTEARAVRAAAQSRLAELRAARRAKFGASGDPPPAAGGGGWAEAVPAPVPPNGPPSSAGAPADPARPVPPAGARAIAVSAKAADLSLSAAGAAAPPPDDAAAEEPQGAADAGAQGRSGGDVPEAVEPPSDLAELPGIGPGLIGLLARAGVRSRADLAAADLDALGERLGLVGQLIDLRAWAAAAGSAAWRDPGAPR